MFLPDAQKKPSTCKLPACDKKTIRRRAYTVECFELFDKQNPHVWKLFERFSLQAAERQKRFSARAVFQRMRWETEITQGIKLKVDDGWVSHYARKFIRLHPSLEGFFKTRKRKGGYHHD